MWKHLLIMALILAGLIAWDWRMTERTVRARAEGVRIERLLDAATLFSGERPIAALRLDKGDGQVHLYARAEGVWRCITAHGAIALNEDIATILTKLAGPEFPQKASPPQGAIRTRDPKMAHEYGFDTEEMLTLSLCGPDVLDDPAGDVIYALDIGRSITGTGGSYVRPVGTNDVWEINVDFRKVLGTEHDSTLPPMLDPHVVPADWPGFRPPGVDRIVIETTDAPPIELQRIERELSDEEEAEGAPPWHWSVTIEERSFVGDTMQVFSYGGFLMRAPYTGILGPHDPRELGFDQPRGRVTLRSVHGPLMQLVIGRRTPRGGVPVFNTFSGNLFEVEPGIAEIMLPEMDMLLFDHLGNPWEPFLR